MYLYLYRDSQEILNSYEKAKKLKYYLGWEEMINKYNVSIFTVEHNFIEEKKNKVKDLLEKNNYLRVFEKISAFDGWYIKQDVPRLNNIFK